MVEENRKNISRGVRPARKDEGRIMKITHNSEIEKVKEDLDKAYHEAKKLRFVNNPVAYALYQVWRKYDINTNNQRSEEP